MADSDRRELTDDLGLAVRVAQRGHQAAIWTALPGFVKSFDSSKMTCEVQPTIQAQVITAQGVTKWATLPLLVDCPVVFPSGGGFTLTFPIKTGDEVLVVFASRCIDSWWQSGGVQVQAELRMHDLSDGFVLPGVRSRPRVLSGISPTQAQLRSDDGMTFVAIDPTGLVEVVAQNSVAIVAPVVNVTGNLVVSGTITAADIGLAAGLPSYKTHTHTGVQTGGGTSGPPKPGS